MKLKKEKYEEKRFWGKGFTIKNILKNFNSIDRENIKQKNKNKYFDLGNLWFYQKIKFIF